MEKDKPIGMTTGQIHWALAAMLAMGFVLGATLFFNVDLIKALAHSEKAPEWAQAITSSIAIIVAVTIPIAMASQRLRESDQVRSIRATALAGELAISLMPMAHQIQLAIDDAYNDKNLPGAQVDNSVSKICAQLSVNELNRAINNADAFEKDLASLLGGLSGYVNALRFEALQYVQAPQRLDPGFYTIRASTMLYDTALRINAVQQMAWTLGGHEGESPVPKSFEKMARRILDLEKLRALTATQ
jgi:membrane protein implicated in regulation of membrane protease activity